MKILTSVMIILLIREIITVPLPKAQEDGIESRRRKHKRRRRPCARNAEEARWFFGHDLTLFLGDVTICTGANTGANTEHQDSNSGIYEDVVPVIQRPHKPHRPRPQHNNNIKPVEEDVDDDLQDNYYKPGPLVGVLNNQVQGQQQNLPSFNPTRIFHTFSRHFNRIVNPFIDLFYK